MGKSKKNEYNLKEIVLLHSEASDWKNAIREWEVIDYHDCGNETKERCICNQPNLRHLYRIKNKLNSQELFPIGSTCIKNFFDDRLHNKSVELKKKHDEEVRKQNELMVKKAEEAERRRLEEYRVQMWKKREEEERQKKIESVNKSHNLLMNETKKSKGFVKYSVDVFTTDYLDYLLHKKVINDWDYKFLKSIWMPNQSDLDLTEKQDKSVKKIMVTKIKPFTDKVIYSNK